MLVSLLLLLGFLPTQFAYHQAPVEELIDAGHWKRARPILEARIERNGNDADALFLLSQVKLAFQDFDSSLKFAEKSVELTPKNADFHAHLARVLGEIADKSGMFKQISYGRRFKNEAELALNLDPGNLDARYELMLLYMKAPSILGGNVKKAEALLQEMIRLRPWEGYMAEGRLAQEQGNLARVESAYLSAIRVAPAKFDSRIALATLLLSFDRSRHAEAELHAREAIKISPSSARAYAVLASVFAEKQRWSELDDILQQSTKDDPDNLLPYYEGARVLLAINTDLPRAEQYLSKYLSQEAEGESPTHAQAHRLRGLVFERQGYKVQAIAELKAALKLQPDFEDAKQDLKRLN